MCKQILLTFFLLAICNLGFAQHNEPCASHTYLNQLDAEYPGFRDATRQVYSRVRSEGQARDLTLLTIPVVIHIVYQNEDQNLPDSLVTAVMEVLNQDYRRMNTDAHQVREVFLPVVEDPFIQFELAGVERVSTTAVFELNIFGAGLPDNVKQTTAGGSDAWDTEHYLNIWVCNIEGGALLGYAYPPADLAHWPAGAAAPSPGLDGVVVHHEVFRRSGTFTTTGLLGLDEITIPVRGRTITHEVGHYLGLRHIWGDGTLAIFGIPDCNADDGVEDTPNQGLSSQFVCDADSNSCNEGADDRADMWENFMDYSREDCQNSFTIGQIEIMRSVLMNERSGLIEGSVNAEDLLLAQDEINVFPNPASNFMQISRTGNAAAALSLYNSQGQLVRQWSGWQSEQLEISTAELPAGLYYLAVISETGSSTKAVVIE